MILHKIYRNTNRATNRATKKTEKHKTYKLLNDIKKLFKSTNYETARDILRKIFINLQISETQFDEIYKQVIPFNKSGHSGAIIGSLQNNKQNVIKIFTDKLNINNSFIIFDCLKISNRFNEIFINYLLTNLNNIIQIQQDAYKKIKKHIIPILDYGICNKGSYIVIPLIGITNNTTGQYKNKLITNLRELLEFNHNEFILKALNENRNDILEEYDKFMSEKIKDYFKVLKILQKYLKYLNSDVKLTNVFIKKDNTSTNKLLNDWGFITDFVLILSDLEKSSININNLRITTETRSHLKIMLAKLIKKGLIYDIRYGCDILLKSCKKIDFFDIDILTFIIDYYAFMLRINYNFINEMHNIFNTMNTFININILNVTIKLLTEGKYKIDKHYSYIIGNILQKICNTL